MEKINEIRDLLENLMEGITSIFGKNCEVVLHDLNDNSYDRSIVSIINGHVTERKVGDPSTNLGLKIIRGIEADDHEFGYITQTKQGKTLKSSSIYIKNSGGVPIGALCINFDISNFLLFEKSVQSITNSQTETNSSFKFKEHFTNNIHDLLNALINESINYVGKPTSLMNRDEKKKGIEYLDRKGALLIKKSGSRICDCYGISKHALYTYLEDIRTSKN